MAADSEAALAGAGVTEVVRRAGKNAIETSMAIAQLAIDEGMSANFMGVATTSGYWDALTGGPLCGLRGGVLVLASPANTNAAGLSASYKDQMLRGYVLGGRGALPDEVMSAFVASTQ